MVQCISVAIVARGSIGDGDDDDEVDEAGDEDDDDEDTDVTAVVSMVVVRNGDRSSDGAGALR